MGTDAADRILKLVGRDFKTMTSSSFLLQGQGEKIITAKPSQRCKVVFDILGLDRFGKYREKLGKRRSRHTGERAVLEQVIREASKLASQKDALEEGLTRATGLVSAISADIAGKEVSVEELSRQIVLAEAMMSERTALLRERDDKLVTLAALNERVAASLAAVSGAGLTEDEVLSERVKELTAFPDGMQRALTEVALLEAKLGRSDEVDKEIISLDMRIDRLIKQLTELGMHSERYRKILDNRVKILSFVEEERGSKERLSQVQSGIEEVQRTISRIAETLRMLSDWEAAAAKMKSAVQLREKTRESDLKHATDRLEAARRVSALIGEVPCGAQGDFAACKLLRQAVEARDSMPGLNAEVNRLSQPLDMPERAELMSIEEMIKSVDRAALEIESRQAAESARALSMEKGTLEKRLEVLATWTSVAPEIATAETERARIVDQMSLLEGEAKEASETRDRLVTEKEALKLLQDELSLARFVVEHLKAWEFMQAIESERASLDRVLTDLGRRLDAYAAVEADHRVLMSRLEVVKADIVLQREKERELLGQEARLKTEIGHCLDAERKIEETAERLSEADRSITVCDVLSEAYEKLPFYILDNVLPIMEDEANRVLEEISDTGMRMELRTERQNKTNANVDDTVLDIIVSDMAGERPIELYSGGEKTRQILALAVGLAELSARKAGVKIETILIDEPAGLDEQGLVDFGRCFVRLIEAGVFKKGILVAHEEVLKNVFDQRILVSKKGTVSEVEIVRS